MEKGGEEWKINDNGIKGIEKGAVALVFDTAKPLSQVMLSVLSNTLMATLMFSNTKVSADALSAFSMHATVGTW